MKYLLSWGRGGGRQVPGKRKHCGFDTYIYPSGGGRRGGFWPLLSLICMFAYIIVYFLPPRVGGGGGRRPPPPPPPHLGMRLLLTTPQLRDHRHTSTKIHTYTGNVAPNKQTKGLHNKIHTHTHNPMEPGIHKTTSCHGER